MPSRAGQDSAYTQFEKAYQAACQVKDEKIQQFCLVRQVDILSRRSNGLFEATLQEKTRKLNQHKKLVLFYEDSIHASLSAYADHNFAIIQNVLPPDETFCTQFLGEHGKFLQSMYIAVQGL